MVAQAVQTVQMLKCPKCRKISVECIHWENGHGFFRNDNYRHRCTNLGCGFVEESRDNHGVPLGQESASDTLFCPMCGQDHLAP